MLVARLRLVRRRRSACFFYTAAQHPHLTMPMAVLVGILLGLSRLSADSEVTAMRASGIGVHGTVRLRICHRRRSLAFAWGSLASPTRSTLHPDRCCSAPPARRIPPQPAGHPSKSSPASSTKTSRTTFSTCRTFPPGTGASPLARRLPRRPHRSRRAASITTADRSHS